MLLIPLFVIVLLAPGVVFTDNLGEEVKYDKLTRDEKIDLNGKRAKEILESLGGYDEYKEFMKSDEDSKLKDEIKELNQKMSELGIMTLEEFNDPVKRLEFYLDHPEIIEEEHDNVEHGQ